LVTICCASARPAAAELVADADADALAVLAALLGVLALLGGELTVELPPEPHAAIRAALLIAAPVVSQCFQLCVIASNLHVP
jgi:hypothetical protein